jgi:hypothetical protein
MTNLYELTYKNTAKARKAFTRIVCGQSGADAARSMEGEEEVVLSVRCIGEHAGDWCQI